MFDYTNYADHPGRNPKHVPGGYVRYINVAIDPKNPLVGTFKKYIRPKNPSRWLPHVGGASAGVRIVPPTYDKISRQRVRYMLRMEAKVERRLEAARRRST